MEDQLKIRIRLAESLLIETGGLPAAVSEALEKALVFNNPMYFRSQRFADHHRGVVSPTIDCIRRLGGALAVPRGFMFGLINLLHGQRVPFEVEDRTWADTCHDHAFTGVLQPHQQVLWDEIENKRFGVLQGVPNTGKKVIACRLIAVRKTRALIVVKSRRQLYQWKETVGRFLHAGPLDRRPVAVGLIGDGHRDLDRTVTVGIDRSLYRHVPGLKGRVGFLIADHCNAANLKIFFDLVAEVDSRYMLGLATGPRHDGLDTLMLAYLGRSLGTLAHPPEHSATGTPIRVKTVRTGFAFDYRDNYADMITALCADPQRNRRIVADILAETAAAGTRALVLSERLEHLQTLKALLAEAFKHQVETITGRTPDRRQKEIEARIRAGRTVVLLLTCKSIERLVDVGFDRLFIACPMKFEDHMAQVVGRLTRAPSGRHAPIVYDYLDAPGVLKASFKRRARIYRSVGADFDPVAKMGKNGGNRPSGPLGSD